MHPAAIAPRTTLTSVTLWVSAGVALSCGWLAVMELVLQHPGFAFRLTIDAAIVAEAALTIAAAQGYSVNVLRWPIAAGAIVTALLGWWVVAEDLGRADLPARPHFEGYLLMIGLALIAYGVVATAAMVTARSATSWAPRS